MKRTAVVALAPTAMLLACVACGLACAGPARSAPAEVVAPGSAPALLNESIVFFAGFDRGSVEADLALGRAKPLRSEGEVRFVPGRFGDALLIGGGAKSAKGAKGGSGVRLEYAASEHLDFGRPGALSFWVKPMRWTDPALGKRGYVKFVTVPARKGSFVVQRMGLDRELRRKDRFMAGAFKLPRTNHFYLSKAGTEDWDDERWHLVVINWTPDSLALSLDGEAFTTRPAPGGLEIDAFRTAQTPLRFIVGDRHAAETSAIDEVTLYSHPLSEEEVAALAGALR